MNFLTRVRLFVRDYFDEFGVAWSLARTRDCERNGGHRWGDAHSDSLIGWSKTCSRCGCSETVDTTTTTGATTTTNTVYRFDLGVS